MTNHIYIEDISSEELKNLILNNDELKFKHKDCSMFFSSEGDHLYAMDMDSPESDPFGDGDFIGAINAYYRTLNIVIKLLENLSKVGLELELSDHVNTFNMSLSYLKNSIVEYQKIANKLNDNSDGWAFYLSKGLDRDDEYQFQCFNEDDEQLDSNSEITSWKYICHLANNGNEFYKQAVEFYKAANANDYNLLTLSNATMTDDEISELFEFCKDTAIHDGCLPVEFEINSVVWLFENFINFINKEQHDELSILIEQHNN